MGKQTELVMAQDMPKQNAIKIHVYGDMMPFSVFNQILQIMKENQSKQINFAAYTATMLLLIRESIPKEFYDKLELITDADCMQLYQNAV